VDEYIGADLVALALELPRPLLRPAAHDRGVASTEQIEQFLGVCGYGRAARRKPMR
jgi:hypothetical protein